MLTETHPRIEVVLADDLLDPQLGDEVPQSDPYQELAGDLADRLKRRYAGRDDVKVAADMKMLWGIPGLPEPSPDSASPQEARLGAHQLRRGEGRGAPVSASERATREAAGRREAEKRATAAEAELARLRAELERRAS